MTNAKKISDDQLPDFFENAQKEYLVITSPTCHKCHKLVKECETVNRQISFYVLENQYSLGANILVQLEIMSAPTVIYANEGRISLLTGEGSFDAIFKWMDEQKHE